MLLPFGPPTLPLLGKAPLTNAVELCPPRALLRHKLWVNMSYVWCGRRGQEGLQEGQLREPRVQGRPWCRPPSRTPPWTWARRCCQWPQSWG